MALNAEELKIPSVASGGMADARSLGAALASGAEGMTMGTRARAQCVSVSGSELEKRLPEAA